MMKWLRDIFGRIWAFYAAIVFVVSMLIFFVPFLLFCYFLPEPRRSHRFNAQTRVWMTIFLWLIGAPLRISGKKHFAPGKNYIVVCNHRSFMDVPVMTPMIPGGNKTIAKVELARIPLFGMLYRTGSVLVDRKSDASRKESFAQMTEVLNEGLHMCIYPEGTRNLTSEPLRPFQNGAFRLARSTGKAIIPAIIFHTNTVLPTQRTFYAMPHRLDMHFLAPIEPGELTMEELRDKVFEVMKTYYEAHTKR